MKKLNNLLVVLVIIFGLPFISCANIGHDDEITGNGKVIKKDRAVSSFSGINVTGGIEIVLDQGNDVKMQIEADENLIENIVTKVENGILSIHPDKGVRNATEMKVYLTFKELNSIKATGGCEVSAIEGLNLSDLAAELTGGCELKLDLKVNDLTCKLTGGCEASLSGSAQEFNVTMTGGSELDADELKAVNCSIEATGACEADVHANGKLDISAIGGSEISYSGNPSALAKSSTGGSQIHEAD